VHVLDDLRGENRTETLIRLRPQILGCFGQLDLVSLPPRVLHHLGQKVDSLAAEPDLRKEIEELPTPAADINDRPASATQRKREPLRVWDEFLRAAKDVLETDVDADSRLGRNFIEVGVFGDVRRRPQLGVERLPLVVDTTDHRFECPGVLRQRLELTAKVGQNGFTALEPRTLPMKLGVELPQAFEQPAVDVALSSEK